MEIGPNDPLPVFHEGEHFFIYADGPVYCTSDEYEYFKPHRHIRHYKSPGTQFRSYVFSSFWDPEVLAERVIPILPEFCTLDVYFGRSKTMDPSLCAAIADIIRKHRVLRFCIDRAIPKVIAESMESDAGCWAWLHGAFNPKRPCRLTDVVCGGLGDEDPRWFKLPWVKMLIFTDEVSEFPLSLPPQLKRLTINFNKKYNGARKWPELPRSMDDLFVHNRSETPVPLPDLRHIEQFTHLSITGETSGSAKMFLRNLKPHVDMYCTLRLPSDDSDFTGALSAARLIYPSIAGLSLGRKASNRMFRRLDAFTRALSSKWRITFELVYRARVIPTDCLRMVALIMGWPMEHLSPWTEEMLGPEWDKFYGGEDDTD